MATTVERLGVVETKVANLDEKIDDLKVSVRDVHDCLDRTGEDLKAQLEDIRTKYTLLSRFTLVERLVFGMVAVVLATVLGAILAGAIPGGN